MNVIDWLGNGAMLVAAFYAAKLLFADEIETLISKTDGA